MMKRTALFASLIGAAGVMLAAQAQAAVTYTTAVTVTSGNPVNALVVGDVVTIDVTLRSDGEAAFGLGASATGYDTNVVTFTSGDAVTDVLVQACQAPFGCLNGITNDAAGALAENTSNPLGPEVQIMNGLTLTGTEFTGEQDEGVDGQAGTAQFQLVFTAAGNGSTTIDIGANTDFGDALIVNGGLQGVSNNALVALTVPEPGLIASSALALASVFGVIGIRRRG